MISSDEWYKTEEVLASTEHNVQFYENDDFLADRISAFMRAGLDTGESCLVIATKAHRDQIKQRLKAEGSYLSVAPRAGRYIALDAAETLTRFMVDGTPDPNRFAQVVGDIIAHAARGRPPRHVRVFGEMVALLWSEGNHAAALHLEGLWNELQETLAPFSLYCAYPMGGFAGEALKESFSAICGQHAHVFPAESYAALATIVERERAITLLQQKASSLEAEIVERKQVEERLREMEARKDTFISMASHELKTPVTSLKAFTQILQRRMAQRADTETLTLVNRMGGQLEKLTNLIGDLLDVSTMQTGVLIYRDERFDVDAMVRETIADVQVMTTTHLLRVRGETGAQIFGDRDRLAQALINLLTNAIKYSPQADNVVVRLSADPGGTAVEVAVQDFGLGIAEKHHARIFERFYQAADVTGNTFPGLGIGLYIAREIVERHSGRLWLESREGEGSTFSVVLPCLRPDEVRPDADVMSSGAKSS